MKKTVKLLAVMICLFLAISLASCVNVDEKVNEATAPLNDKITSLNGQITELQGKLDALEGENEALEAEKAALAAEKEALEKELAELKAEVEACDHVWNSETNPEYTWADDFSSCTATFLCIDCGEYAEEIAYQIDEDAKGNYIAFFDKVPSYEYLTVRPTVTGIGFNSDSTGYDEDTNTFSISEKTPFVLTIFGENLSSVSEKNDFMIYLNIEGTWYVFDRIFDTGLHSPVIEEEKIEYQFDPGRVQVLADSYGSINGIGLGDAETGAMIDSASLDLNLVVNDAEDDVEFLTVKTADELLNAFTSCDYIKLGADIESVNGFDVTESVTLDLAGYDLRVTGNAQATFWIYQEMTIINSSEETSKMYREIYAYPDSTLKISGNVSVEATHHSINGDGFIDLTGYTGEELYIYTERLSGLVIPEGYAFYETSDERRVDDYRADDIYEIYVRPLATEVSTAEELIAAFENGGHILLTDNITVDISLYTNKDVSINLGGYSLTLTNDSDLGLHSENAVVKNGTIEVFGNNAALKTYVDNLTVDGCTLISREYIALYCCDGVTTVKNSWLIGGVNASNSYTDAATVYMLDNNILDVDDSLGICISQNGVLITSFDPTDMLGEYYNDGVVTANGDGTFTVKVN